MNRTLVTLLCSLADQPASASQFVRRHLLRPEGRAAIADLLSRVKT
jgi:hypothetical protein